MRKIEARVEYEIPRIRHMSIQCPTCHNWFIANDVADKIISDRFDATTADYECPLCYEHFGKDQSDEINFDECSTGLIYDKTKRKVEHWE